MYPADLKYTSEHEWIKIEGNKARMGITFHAQEELGDIVFVELPELDSELSAGQGMAVVESVKAVSDVYAPVSGIIVEVNESLQTSPELVNKDSYGEGWIAVMELKDPKEAEELMDASAYEEFLESE